MYVEKISVRLLRVPLKTPYHLVFGAISAFDTILVEINGTNDLRGFGEATILTGYTNETLDGSWRLAGELAQRLIGMEFGYAKRTLNNICRDAPFTRTAFITAMEMAERHPLLLQSAEARIPLVGLVQGDSDEKLGEGVEQAIAEGYQSLKFKVGFDVRRDLERVALIQRHVEGRCKLRLDANQGYSRLDALHFVTQVDPGGIELFEQPCDAEDWESACAVAKVSKVPMMLDESIFGIEDINRAAQTAAATFIKLKLMKMGSLSCLAEGLRLIAERGMTSVLGNGVATDIGCWMEACVAKVLTRTDGEMNGALKTSFPLVMNPPRFVAGAIILEKDYWPVIDRDAVRECTQSKYELDR